MQSLSATERAYNLQALANNHVDVLIIGGGVTGAGVALDAAARGYSVALVEKADFASGTSSKSTKLVHGGIRYLPNFDIALVHEALVERGLLLQNAPYLVSPLAFVLPIYEGDRHPVGMPFSTPGGVGLSQMLNIGLEFYDRLAGKRNVAGHRHLSREEVLRLAPALVSENLREGFVYYDAQTNDVRLTMALMRTAARFGATISNYAEVTSFVTEQGQVRGAHIKDNIGGRDITIYARHIINATGIFSEQVEALTGTEPQVQIMPSKGVHLVLSKELLQLGDSAIVLPETDDKRILFIVPWESRAIFGTTDTGTGDLDHPTATQEDVEYLLKYLNRYLSIDVAESDIISTYAGYRPLVKARNSNATTAKLSRTHAVLQSPSGLVTIVGGKLTTYRRMAQDTIDVLNRRDGATTLLHPTQSLPLQGSAAWPRVAQELKQRGASLNIPAESIQHLGGSYGSDANSIMDLIQSDAELGQRLIEDLPYLRAEVIYACRHEMALKPADILSRRTSITLEDRDRGVKAAEQVASLMARELSWSAMEQSAMVQAYRDSIEGQMLAEKS